ncbi:hypothetical protein GIB67_019189, partial [Kingdonia uniflora]
QTQNSTSPFQTTSNYIMKPLKVEVLEAITTYSRLYSGQTRLHHQTQCLNITLHYEGTRGRGTRSDYNLFKLILGASSTKYPASWLLVQPVQPTFNIQHISLQSLIDTLNSTSN